MLQNPNDFPFSFLFEKLPVEKNLRYFAYFLLLYPIFHILVLSISLNLTPLSILNTNAFYTPSLEDNWVLGIAALSVDFIAAILLLKGYRFLGSSILLFNGVAGTVILFRFITYSEESLIILLASFFIYLLGLWKFIIFYFLAQYNSNKDIPQNIKTRKFLFAFLILLVITPSTIGFWKIATLKPPKPFVPKIVSEHRTPLGHGYFDVSRSQTTHPRSFEGISHYQLTFFEDIQLCHCEIKEEQISPNGQYLLLQDEATNNILVFNSKTKKTKILLPGKSVGFINTVMWRNNQEVWVALYDNKVDMENPARFIISDD